MNLIRTEQINIDSNNTLSNLCHLSKNLYNEANYLIRQEFFANGKWIQYRELDKLLQSSDNYKQLPSQSAQYTVQILDKNWKSFFASVKEYTKHPDKFLGKPKLPNYKPKDGEFLLKLNNRTKIKDGIIQLPKKFGNIQIKTRLPDNINLREMRIIPKGIGYICEIIYKKRISEENIINRRWYAKNNNILGIDYGVDNIITMVNNIGEQPIIIKGSIIKSLNQWYNKRKAELQSIYDRQKIKSGNSLTTLTSNRNNKIKDQMHRITRYVIDYCVEHNISTIVIGHNDRWKQEVNIGKRNNQNFVTIPYNISTNQIKYKGEEVGIKTIEVNESHTSKCSFLDNEPICHQKTYLGKRIKRGLFISSKGLLINADVQGALNSIKKAFPKAFADGIVVHGLIPKRLSILALLS